MQACKFLDDKWFPKFTVIVAQKNHHTRFFLPNDRNNVPPGNLSFIFFFHLFIFTILWIKRAHFICSCTYFLYHKFLLHLYVGTVVDDGICHPRNYDFYMCAHNGMIVCSLYLELWSELTLFTMFIWAKLFDLWVPGNYKANTLPCAPWWHRLLSWWAAGARPFPILCVCSLD
jgi:hypothetical protein